jgi:2-keto-4-pentenoate hydratase
MPLNPAVIEELAGDLHRARQDRVPIDTLSTRYPDLDEAGAYAIAAAGLRMRMRPVAGYKLGYTSAAMRRQMNIDQPNYGVLTDDMLVEWGTLAFDALIHPLVEPEIAIRLGRDLAGAGHTRESVMRADPVFMPAIEVCDTRYREYKFGAVDNIADNSSAAFFALGPPRPVTPGDDPRAMTMELWLDGTPVDQGIGANAMDDPLLAVAWLADRLHAAGEMLEAGKVVLTGGLTRGHFVQRHQTVAARLMGFESAMLRFF